MYSGSDKTLGGLNSNDAGDQGESMEVMMKISLAEEYLVVKGSQVLPDSYSEVNDEDFLVGSYIDSVTGALKWSLIVDEEIYYSVISRSQLVSMLKDTIRNDAYEKAIQAAIEKFCVDYGKKPIVLDIGTGSGLLTLMAARHNAEHVIACEMFKPLSSVANYVISTNGVTNATVLQAKSTEVEFEPKADILITEIFDSVLLGEGALPSMRHAHENLLTEDVVVIPNGSTVYAQLIECPSILSFVSLNEGGLNFFRNDNSKHCRGKGTGLPIHVSNLEYKALSKAVDIFDFDYHSIPDPGEYRSVRKLEIQNTGTAHGVLLWWNISLDSSTNLSTVPGSDWWQDHWLQVIFPLKQDYAIDNIDLNIYLKTMRNDFTFWFDLTNEENYKPFDTNECYCGMHELCNYERIWMISDKTRQEIFQAAISEVSQDKATDEWILDIGDGSYCSLIAAHSNVTNLVSVEEKDLSYHILNQIIHYNGLQNSIELAHIDFEEIQHHLKGRKISAVVAEPYFYQLHNLLVWRMTSYWLQCNYLRNNGLITEQTKLMPFAATLKGILVEFDKLKDSSFGALGTVSGFDHTQLDTLLQNWYTYDYQFQTWMYNKKILSEPFDLCSINFHSTPSEYSSNISIPISNPGTLHAMIIWTDYHLTETISYSENDGDYYKKTVRFFQIENKQVQIGDTINILTAFNPESASFDYVLNCSN